MRRFFGQLGAARRIAQAAALARLVPQDASYVTAGPLTRLDDARRFIGGEPGQGPYGRDLGWLPGHPGTEPGLLILQPGSLTAMGERAQIWTCPMSEVVDLDGHRRSGFVVLTRGVSGLAVGTQTPVEVPAGAGWRTIKGWTNAFGGWDVELRPFGVRSHW